MDLHADSKSSKAEVFEGFDTLLWNANNEALWVQVLKPKFDALF